MTGNPNHSKDGKFSSGPSGLDKRREEYLKRRSGVMVNATGHNAGGGDRAVVDHVVQQHHEVHPNFPNEVPKTRPGSMGARQVSLRKLRGY